MPRYIDADALIKKMFPLGIGDGKYTINAKAVKFAIDNAHTADVAPRSEVDLYRKQVDELEDELASTYDKLETAKTEVAREIFEEIEDGIDEELNSLSNRKEKAKDVDSWCALDGWMGGLDIAYDIISNLKKKYTEDSHGNE